jgi:hypothetical protein
VKNKDGQGQARTEEAVKAEFAEVNRQVDAMDSEIDQMAAQLESLGKKIDEMIKTFEYTPGMTSLVKTGITSLKKERSGRRKVAN